MEEEIQSSIVSGPFLPLGASIVGVALGAAALFVAINSASRAGAIEETYKNNADKIANFSGEIDNIKKRIADASSSIDAIKAQSVDTFKRDVNSSLLTLSKSINEDRTAIKNLQDAIKELATRQVATAQQTATPSNTAAEPNTVGEGNMRKYKVEKGDNFTFIAKKFGKRVADIEKANPGVSSNRLNLGQQINIPQ